MYKKSELPNILTFVKTEFLITQGSAQKHAV